MALAADPPWQEAFAIFERLILLDPAGRDRELGGLKATRPVLYAHVVTLVRASEQAQSEGFLEASAMEELALPPPTLSPNDLFGPYRLERPLGAGGMGDVWLATRADGLYEGHVAIKTLHPYLAQSFVRERFAREGRLLAKLQHPNIARLLDAGVAASHVLYLVLEYVEGERLDLYCDANRLAIEPRLRLFLTICEAVSHAHAHLVVHRDLKPSNILVTPAGDAKLLDFGIAKLVEPETTSAPQTELTQLAGRALTPEYAAPEQFLEQPVTVATDVYSLGVLLYHLLSGCAPYGAAGMTPKQIEHEVLETEPPPPSRAAVTLHGADVDSIAALRSSTAAQLRDAIAGDLDTIVLKALKKAPHERYASVAAFADDLRRHLDHRPVQARPDSLAYRAHKYLRRHRLGVAAAATVAVAVAAGVVSTAWQSDRARHEAERAQAEAQRATATKDFLLSIFKASDGRFASDRPRGEITARELLDLGAERVEKEFATLPELQIELLGMITDIYESLADEEHYTALQRRRADLALMHYGPKHPIVIQGLISEAEAAIYRQEYEKAAQIFVDADTALRGTEEDQGLLRAKWWAAKVELLGASGGSNAEVDEALEMALKMYERLAPTSTAYAAVLGNADYIAGERNQFDRAIEYGKRALAVFEAAPDRNDQNMQIVLGNLAFSYEQVGRVAAADDTYTRAEDLALKTQGEHHQAFWLTSAKHARLLHRQGQVARAREMFDRVLRAIPDNWSATNGDHWARGLHGICLAAEGRADEAVPLLEVALQSFLKRDYSNEVPFWRLNLGNAYDRAGRTEEAHKTLALALQEFKPTAIGESATLANYRERWGRFLIDHANGGAAALTDAELVLAPAAARADEDPSASRALAQAGLSRIALARGDTKAAERHIKAALETLDHVKEVYDLRTEPMIWLVRSAVSLSAGDPEDAREWAERALKASEQLDDPSSAAIAQAKAALRLAQG